MIRPSQHSDTHKQRNWRTTSCPCRRKNGRLRYSLHHTVRLHSTRAAGLLTNKNPLDRCLQTSKPISNALNVPIYPEHGKIKHLCFKVLFELRVRTAGLSEWYSPIKPGSGLHPRPARADALQQWFPEIDPSWQSIWYPSRKGEDVDECHDRTAGFLEALIPEVERRFGEKHKRILLVSHAATIIALNHSLLGDRSIPMRIGCCTLTEMTRKEDAERVEGGWTAVKIGDGSHMEGGATREWGFEDVVVADGKVSLLSVTGERVVECTKVIEDPGQPGTEGEDDHPVGLQLPQALSARM